MEQNIGLYIILFIICLILSAFFSSAETAFMTLQNFRINHMIKSGKGNAKIVQRILNKPGRFLSTVLLGNNLVNTAIVTVGSPIIAHLLFKGNQNGNVVIVQTVILTIIILILGEILPKLIANSNKERVALIYARPMQLTSFILYPGIVMLDFITSGISRLFGKSLSMTSILSIDDIQDIVAEGFDSGTVRKNEAVIIKKVLKLRDHCVRDVMIPRANIIWIGNDLSLADFIQIYAKYPYSYFPVYENNIDNVLGMLASRDVFVNQAKWNLDKSYKVAKLVLPYFPVPETKPLGELFQEMQDKKQKTAMIIDEYGQIRGMVTTEQLAEEIVGHLGSDFTRYEKSYEPIDKRTYSVDGEMLIEEANEELGLSLPVEGDKYTTVAGFVLHLLHNIPKENDQLKYNNVKIQVMKMRGNKILQLLISQN